MAEAKKEAKKSRLATSESTEEKKTSKSKKTTREKTKTPTKLESELSETSLSKPETENEITVNTGDASLGSEQDEASITKAGKRSAKAIQELEEKQAKEERKAKATDEPTAKRPKTAQKPVRSHLERRSKNYRKSAELIKKGAVYNLVEALDLATKTSTVKFDASVELHVNLEVDPKQADQNIRQTVVLPAGTGKTARIAVFADADDITKAKKAGADIAAADEFLQQLEKGEINFDILIATPAMMPKLGKYARLLGPKGLMPNPKSGTVVSNVTKAVTEAKAGRVEYRVDSTGIIHTTVGKVSFGKDKLTQNAKAVLDSVKAAKPASVKGNYVLSIFVTTTMGPSIPVSSSEL